MRNSILAAAALAVIGLAPAAQAQGFVAEYGTGYVRGPDVIVDDDDVAAIAVGRRPAFREYVVREHVPDFAVPGPIVVGRVLPSAGVVNRDVPYRFGASSYRYTVVNGQAVLVEPRTRRVVEIID